MTADTTPSVATALPLMVTTAPERIWLNIFTDGDNEEEFPSDHEGVTWADQDVGDADVPYVRADVAHRAVEAATRELRDDRDQWRDRAKRLAAAQVALLIEREGLSEERDALRRELEALGAAGPAREGLVPVVEAHSKPDVWYSAEEHGWWRYGKFFPGEVWGDGPFFHDDYAQREPAAHGIAAPAGTSEGEHTHE